jgi:predicted AAA+ superfamily ATPase
MALSNRQRIEQGLDELKSALLPFVEEILTEAAKGPRKDEVRLAVEECEVRVVDGKPHWDTQALLRMMIKLWGSLFTHRFPQTERSRMRSLVGEANDIRNRYAHEMPFSYDDTYRDLDTLGRVAEAIGADASAGRLRQMAKTVMRVQFQEEARVDVRKARAMEGTPLAALKPWREVISPHADVAKGTFLESEFVADLHAVHTGQATDEYGNAIDFFARTYLTDGLQDLLRRAMTRLTGSGGSPVIELKTNFGGGKTHSLLALYHLFSDTRSTQLPGLDALLREVGIDDAPAAKRVVIAGHQLGVHQPRRKEGGIRVNTLWGELAWQLGGAEAYETIRSSDEAGTNPGAEALADLLKRHSPCLILIDEWVAYLRETVDRSGLAGGSFESNFGFAQSLTEAAKVAPRALVVASLPASAIEMGGPHGIKAFNELSNLFQRVATPWQSTRLEEGYEIVRRRLFDAHIDYPARDAVVKAFFELYGSAKGSFPANSAEQEYRRKLEACYPIHPELFDKLDAVWSTLDKFQKTRGVLRFMAAVISDLFQRDDRNLLIMPASVSLDSSRVADVIKEVLPAGDAWSGVINSDIDGQAAVASVIDSENPSLGKYSACRRVARSIFIAAAPTQGPNRGVDDAHLLLGCVQPGENPEKMGDALRRLSDRATYLYRDNGRSWFALTPSVTRLAQDRTRGFLEDRKDEVDAEILTRLRAWQGQTVFPGGVQVASVPADLPDENKTRLVLLPPAFPDAKGNNDSKAVEKAEEILTQAANKPRTFRNSVVFLAADEGQLEKLREVAASFLAWSSIKTDEESLELTKHDRNQATEKVKDFEKSVSARMGDAWCRLLVPTVKDPRSSEITWETIACPGAERKIQTALEKLKDRERIYDKFSPFHLKRELERHLWGQRDHISSRDVETAFGSYLFFPRLLKKGLLEDSIRSAFSGQSLLCEFFGYAEGFDDEKERYLGLCTTQPPFDVTIGDSVLVKADVAMAQITPANTVPAVVTGNTGDGQAGTGDQPTGNGSGAGTGGGVKMRRFYGAIDLNPDKVASSVQKVVDEVIQHLTAIYGTKVTISLDIDAVHPQGFDEATMRTVSENAITLGFDRGRTGFEEA